METIVCPRCGSSNVRRSHSHGWREKLKRFFGWRGFRCREPNCHWRGMVKVKRLRDTLQDLEKKYGRKIAAFIVYLLIFYFGYLAVNTILISGKP